MDRLRRGGETWDIIFCDIDKHAYPHVIEPPSSGSARGAPDLRQHALVGARLPRGGARGRGDGGGCGKRGLRLAAHPQLRTTMCRCAMGCRFPSGSES